MVRYSCCDSKEFDEGIGDFRGQQSVGLFKLQFHVTPLGFWPSGNLKSQNRSARFVFFLKRVTRPSIDRVEGGP